MPQEVSNNTAVTNLESGELSKDDILDILTPDENEEVEAEGAPKDKEASPSKPEKKDAKEKKDDEDDEEENQEEVDEDQIPDEEELNLVTPVRRKEILAKYPTIFKDFPYLEQAYYREQHFTEIFPTLDDAKEANQKSQSLDAFESDLMRGDFHKVLGEVKKADPEAFNRLADNYLQELGKVDKDAVHHVIGNVIKNSIINVINEAVRMGEDGNPLKEAAVLFHRAIFGTAQITAATNLAKKVNEEDPEKEQIRKEKQELVRQRFEGVRDDLSTKVTNSIKSTIANHIDPRNSMQDYVKKNAIRNAQEDLESSMGQDKRFSTLMDRLWETAFKENFSPKSIEQIRSTYLSKAKSLLPSIISKHRKEASNASRSEKPDKDRKGPLPIGSHSTTRRQTSNNDKSTSEIPKGMKTLDYFNSD